MQLTALYALVLSATGAAVLGITTVLAFGFRATSVQSVTGAVRSNQFSRDFIAIIICGATALAIVAVASVWVAWLLAGRVMSPLRSITSAAREISATSLDRRLALDGPDDELKELGDTVDGLLERLDASRVAQRRSKAAGCASTPLWSRQLRRATRDWSSDWWTTSSTTRSVTTSTAAGSNSARVAGPCPSPMAARRSQLKSSSGSNSHSAGAR